MKGTIKIRGTNLDIGNISNKLDDLHILIEEIRRTSYEKKENIYIEKIPDRIIDIINESLKKKEEIKNPTLWERIKTFMNKRIF